MARWSLNNTVAARTRHSLRSFFLGESCGQFILLLLGAGLLILLGAFSWMHANAVKCEECDTDLWLNGNSTILYAEECSSDCTFYQACFTAWGLFFDPGTQTGFVDHEEYPYQMKFVAGIFSFFGFIFNLVVLGMVVELLRKLLDRWKRLHRRVIANDHTVVLGWTDKTLFLLEEQARRRSPITGRARHPLGQPRGVGARVVEHPVGADEVGAQLAEAVGALFDVVLVARDDVRVAARLHA